MYVNNLACVRVKRGNRKEAIHAGVRKGILFPWNLNVYMHGVTKAMKMGLGRVVIRILDRRKNGSYSVVSKYDELECWEITGCLLWYAKKYESEMNTDKSKMEVLEREKGWFLKSVWVGGNWIFKYLHVVLIWNMVQNAAGK